MHVNDIFLSTCNVSTAELPKIQYDYTAVKCSWQKSIIVTTAWALIGWQPTTTKKVFYPSHVNRRLSYTIYIVMVLYLHDISRNHYNFCIVRRLYVEPHWNEDAQRRTSTTQNTYDESTVPALSLFSKRMKIAMIKESRLWKLNGQSESICATAAFADLPNFQLHRLHDTCTNTCSVNRTESIDFQCHN